MILLEITLMWFALGILGLIIGFIWDFIHGDKWQNCKMIIGLGIIAGPATIAMAILLITIEICKRGERS